MSKVVVLFGGTFNPPHIGHLALANYVCENYPVDELWFLVTPCNPFKASDELLDDKLRYAMVKAAISGYDKFLVSDVEFSLPRPSYTVDTLAYLRGKYPDNKFILLIGADNWAAFDKWRSPEDIIANHEIYVYGRPGIRIDDADLPSKVKIVDAPMMDISSTFIRKSIKEGKDMRYFTHPSVWKIIKQERLYIK